MSSERTLLVGGLSSVHDPLLAAALRGCGRRAEALHPRTDSGLKLARGFGNHGQCNPAHYAVGAVLEHARSSGMVAHAFCETRAWLTVGSCGPCRLAAFPHEYARVLAGAGLGALPVVLVDQLAFARDRGPAAAPTIRAEEASALLVAVVVADVVVQVAHDVRPYAVEPGDVDALVGEAIADVALALDRRSGPEAALTRFGARARDVPRDPTRVLPRVVLVGEPWTILADGDPSYDLARRLGVFGAEVLAPTAADWLRFRLWEERALEPQRGRELMAADAKLVATWDRLAEAAGCSTRLAAPDDLAALASAHYDPRVRGGSAHLEVGRALQAVRDRTAHLVLSLKPFGCLPSSSLSDGILSVRLRQTASPSFLAIETTGDADATAESRMEMALHAATLTASAELEAASADAAMTTDEALLLLGALGDRPVPCGPRRYACTAAERLCRLTDATRDASPAVPRGAGMG